MHAAFPFKRDFISPAEAQEMFARLKARQTPACARHPYAYDRYNFRSKLPLTTYRGRSVVFESAPTDYLEMNILTDVFTEPQRMKGRLKFQPLSPLDQFAQDAAFRARVSHPDPREVREKIWRTTRECTQFKVVLAVDVYLFFGAVRVLDMCAGWGDRLLAALAVSRVERYASWDPNTELKTGHDAMIKDFYDEEATYLDEKNMTVTYEPFETASLPDGETFNLVFTSPPFADFEIYPGEHQSTTRYPEFLDWFRSFLLASLAKAWSVLEEDGHMVIHLADVDRREMCEPMCLWALAALPGCVYHGTIASVGKAEKPKPLFVFQKASQKPSNREWAAHQLAKFFPHYQLGA